MPVKRLIEPAITQARQGVSINGIQAKIYQVVESIYMSTTESRPLFASKHDLRILIGKGDIFTNIAFDDAMDAIAHEGENLFYWGDISSMIDADCQVGSALRRSDLENYKIFRRDPIVQEYREATFIINPPPSNGGLLISFSLALLDNLSFAKKTFGSLELLQDLAHVMGLTNHAHIEAEIHCEGQANVNDAMFVPGLLEKYWGGYFGLTPCSSWNHTHKRC
jgi:gamma-glutamyltranspeptidase/glutathione hydrolase